MLIQDVDWPSHKGIVHFETLGNIRVNTTPLKWSSSLQLELILSNIAYYYTVVLENPTMGRIDIFKTKKDIPAEIDITILLREYKIFFFEESCICETMSPPMFQNKVKRFAIDDWVWNHKIGGFTKDTLDDIEVPNISFIYANSDWGLDLIPFLTQQTFPETESSFSIRVNCHLILDESADQVDFRILNMNVIQSLQYLRMKPNDYFDWVDKCAVGGNTTEARDFIAVRKSLELAKSNGKYCVHPNQIHWKTVSHELRANFHYNADHRFIVFFDAAAWATMLPHKTHILRTKEFSRPEATSIILRNAMRLPKDVRGLTVRMHFSTPTPAEKLIMGRFPDHHRMMQCFGLHFFGKWTTKPALLAIHKRQQTLGSNYIDSCFDGFAHDSAKGLLETKKECPICSNAANSLLDNCGHVFCDTCIKSHMEVGGNNCPICRETLGDWTVIKRSTSRQKTSEHFSKKETLLKLIFLPEVVLVLPSSFIKEQVEDWTGTAIDSILMDVPFSREKKYLNIILLSSLLNKAWQLKVLHDIFQSLMKDGTTLHILIDDQLPEWIGEFSSCYKNICEVSMYH